MDKTFFIFAPALPLEAAFKEGFRYSKERSDLWNNEIQH